MYANEAAWTHTNTHTHNGDVEELGENQYSYGAQGREEAGK